MTRLGGDGMVFLKLSPQAQLSAPLYLARREDVRSSAIINAFCSLVKAKLAGD